MIKAVLFDYGGVVKVEHPLTMDLTKICDKSDKEIEITREERMHKYGIPAEKGFITDEDYWKGVFQIFGGEPPQSPKESVELAQKFYRDSYIFVPEVINLAKELRGQGIITAILSNIFKFSADVTREKNGYDEFSPVILSYEVGMVKPEPEIYQLAIEKLNVKSEEIIFIDDKERNLIPARKLGMKTVLAKKPEQIVKDVLALIEVDTAL